MPDAADAIADRLEIALARIDQARADTSARLAKLEAAVEASVGELDRLLTPAGPR